jgi:hypothetical protein
MEQKEIILLLLILLVIYLIYNKNNNENFSITIKSNSKSEEISEYWKSRNYKVQKVPNFFERFGLSDLNKNLVFTKENNWKLFTNTNLIEDEGLASLISSDNPPFYDIKDKKRVTGFKKTSAVIGIMTPTTTTNPPGQWLKSFIWIGANTDANVNAKKVIIWANHNTNTDIKLDKDGLVDDAIKIFEFEVGQNETLAGGKKYFIENYKSMNHPPFTTYYFQILNNWGNPNTVKVGGLILEYEI